MKKLLPLVVAMLGLVPGFLQAQQSFDPSLAVVRIKSHGGSGTVIWSSQGKSYILSCAHMLPNKTQKPFVVDGPEQPYAPKQLAAIRLLAYDYNADLSLIEIDNGPFWSVPVAPQSHRPSQSLLSAGYDNMTWPSTRRSATYVSQSQTVLFTKEIPWHGRSGGGLIDTSINSLIGVVQGYETGGSRRGRYRNLNEIHRFLNAKAGSWWRNRVEIQERRPQYQPQQQPFQTPPGFI